MTSLRHPLPLTVLILALKTIHQPTALDALDWPVSAPISLVSSCCLSPGGDGALFPHLTRSHTDLQQLAWFQAVLRRTSTSTTSTAAFLLRAYVPLSVALCAVPSWLCLAEVWCVACVCRSLSEMSLCLRHDPFKPAATTPPGRRDATHPPRPLPVARPALPGPPWS